MKLPEHKFDYKEESEVDDPVAETNDASSQESRESAELSDENPIYKRPEYIYIEFSKRPTFMNKVARVLYLILYSLFAAVWFYFIPFTSIYISYAVPAKYGDAFTSVDEAPDA